MPRTALGLINGRMIFGFSKFQIPTEYHSFLRISKVLISWRYQNFINLKKPVITRSNRSYCIKSLRHNIWYK
jgi:hypothetical protein